MQKLFSFSSRITERQSHESLGEGSTTPLFSCLPPFLLSLFHLISTITALDIVLNTHTHRHTCLSFMQYIAQQMKHFHCQVSVSTECLNVSLSLRQSYCLSISLSFSFSLPLCLSVCPSVTSITGSNQLTSQAKRTTKRKKRQSQRQQN